MGDKLNLFELFVKIGVDDQASGKLSKLSSSLGKGLATAAKIGTAAVSAVGSGIAALGTYAAKVGGDFEAQMSKVSAISGATGDDLQALEDKAKQLGIDTKFSATEAGQAFEYMAMAGWKTEQMLNSVAGIMDLAAASGEDLASVSDIVTDAMTAFGLSADQSTHFADVLAKASSNANTNVGLMGETFKYVAPVAGAMGFNIEDTATAIGLMANAGIKGSQAGTALRAMLSRLAKPTDEVEAAMIKLGLSITNSDGSMRELDEIMADLRKGFDGLTEAEQTEIAAKLAGQEAMSGLLAIVNTSEAEYDKLTTAIYSADGAAKQMADTMANNLQGQFTLLKSSAEGFGLALYDKIQQPLTDMVSWAVDGLNQLTKAFNENGVDGLVEAAGNILSEAINEIVNGLPKIVDLAIQIIDSFIGGINDNLDTIVSGAISVVMTLADGILNMLPKIVQLGLDLIVSLTNGISEAITKDGFIDTIIDVVLQIVDTLTNPDTLKNLLNAAFTLIEALVIGIIENLPALIEAAIQIVLNLIDFITDADNIEKLLQMTVTLIEKICDGLVSAIPQLVDAAIQIITKLCEFFLAPENIKMLLDMSFQIVLAIVQGLIEAAVQLYESIKEIASEVVSKFEETDWKKLGEDIVFFIYDGLKLAWETIKSWFEEVINFISNKFEGKDWKEIGKTIINGLLEGLKSAWETVTQWATDAVKALTDLFSGVKSAIDTIMGKKAEMEAGINPSMQSIIDRDRALENSNSTPTADNFGGYNVSPNVSVTQNIYSSAKTPSELLDEAMYQQERAAFVGV